MLADFERVYPCPGGVATVAWMIERVNASYDADEFLACICNLLRTKKIRYSAWLISSLKNPQHKQKVIETVLLMQVDK